jgi:hypothetical protein
MVTRLRGTAVIVGAMIVVAMSAATPAQASDASLQVREWGSLHARGAAVVVEADVTCFAGSEMTVWVSASQQQEDGSTVEGTTGIKVVFCTGSSQVVRMAIPTDIENGRTGRPFVAGPVLIRTEPQDFGCGGEYCFAPPPATVEVQVSPDVALNDARFRGFGLFVSLPATGQVSPDGTSARLVVTYRCYPGGQSSVTFSSPTLFQRTSSRVVVDGLQPFWGIEPDSPPVCDDLEHKAVFNFPHEGRKWEVGPAFFMVNPIRNTRYDDIEGIFLHRSVMLQAPSS